MKRYRLLGMVLVGTGKPDERIESKMFEDPNGEWIKYEDVKLWIEIKPPHIEIQSVECNCYEYSKRLMYKSCISISWVCPAHGYKERLNFNTKAKLL